MASNFLGFFGKKKEEALAQQGPPQTPTLAVSALPTSPSSSSSFSPGRKKVTQRLSLKSLQAAQKTTGGQTKIQLPGAVAAPAPVFQPAPVEGTVDVPFSVVLMCIPAELLTADHASLMAAPEAIVDIGIPLANVLSMLPSGKLEFSLAEIAQLIPSGFVQPLEMIPDYTNTPIVLPLGEVVGRIPSHLMTLRSDQRPIDSNVLSMQDPFSREALEKAQAEAAIKAAEAAALLEAEQSMAQAAASGFQAEEPPSTYQPDFSAPAEASVGSDQFDASFLAEAEAALEAEKNAAGAGVESYGEVMASSGTSPAQTDWALQNQDSGLEEPEVDPALVEWARKQADEAETAASLAGVELATAPSFSPAPDNEESSSFASSEAFRSFLEQVDSENVSSPETRIEADVPETISGAFKVDQGVSFEALNAATRPIVRPKAPPQPPEIKGFESFTKELVSSVNMAAESLENKSQSENVAEPFVGNKSGEEAVATSVLQSDSPTQLQRIRLSPTINKYLGLDEHSEITFQDIMNQVRSWPGVAGCVIAGKDGLPISAVLDDASFSKSLSAFAPKIVSRVSELFVDLGMPEVQEIQVPMDDLSTFLFREGNVYFIVLYKDAAMPHWYRKVIKAVLEEIGSKHK